MTASAPSLDETAIVPLASGFPVGGREDWLALAERVLKGAQVETLTWRTLEGLPIQPLYPQATQLALPAKARPGWDVRTIIRVPEPAIANRQVLQDLAAGAASVALKLDPTGGTGIAVGSTETLARVLDGALLDAAPVALDAGFLGAKAADWLATVAKGAPAAALALHMDPLSAFAEAGVSPGPIEAHLVACAGVGVRLAEPHPKASLFLASGRIAHEAGGGEALELALAAAAAVAYAKALFRAGLAPADAFGRIVLGLAADADGYMSIAKIRAARLVWANLTGAMDLDIAATIDVRSSGRMLTRADPWTNMIRLSAAGLAAAVGGADAVILGAFTDALGPPSDFARRQARNIQLILMEEANLGRVTDPSAGSGYLEALTQDLARAAWDCFQAIEAEGGVVRALENGLIARRVKTTRTEAAARIKSRTLRIVGVTDFAAGENRPAPLADTVAHAAEAPSPRLPGPDSRCPPLAPTRLEALA